MQQEQNDLNNNESSEPITEQPIQQDTPPSTPSSDLNRHTIGDYIDEHPKKSKKKLLLILATILVIVLAVGVWYFLTQNKKTNTNSSPQVSQPDQNKSINTDKKPLNPELEKFINPTTGETWLSQPKALPDLKLYPSDIEAKYYEVGSRAGKKIIKSTYFIITPMTDIFEQDQAGKTVYIVKPDAKMVINNDELNSQRDSIASKVTFDDKVSYDSLTIPDKIDLGNNMVAKRPQFSILGQPKEEQNPNSAKPIITELKKLGQSTLTKTAYTSNETKLSSVSYEINTPINNKVGLVYEPIETDISGYKWKIGLSSTNGKISPITKGCGSLTPAVTEANNVASSDLEEAGQSTSGKKIYALTSTKHELFVKAYQEFIDFYKTDTEQKYKASMTQDDFAKNHAIIIYKDVDGKILAYVQDEFRPAIGCAKPVVYLYPETEQLINLKVGADVKVSEPLYDPASGWQNVLASPSGLLSYQGKTYRSLFWEGPGYGQYPFVDKGVVVPTREAVATIKSQLAQQGLNTQEINDFVDYWQPNLPTKPYTRLSWLNTEQMNQLAPLKITPKPQTMIRVFLDFDGLDNPIKLQPQTFNAPQRNGFTVVEWGGLSKKSLY